MRFLNEVAGSIALLYNVDVSLIAVLNGQPEPREPAPFVSYALVSCKHRWKTQCLRKPIIALSALAKQVPAIHVDQIDGRAEQRLQWRDLLSEGFSIKGAMLKIELDGFTNTAGGAITSEDLPGHRPG